MTYIFAIKTSERSKLLGLAITVHSRNEKYLEIVFVPYGKKVNHEFSFEAHDFFYLYIHSLRCEEF